MRIQNIRIQHRSLAFFAFIIFFSLYAALLLNFLFFHKYSPFSPEALVLLVAFAVLSLVLAGLAWISRPFGVLLVMFALLFYLYIIIPYDQIIDWVKPFFVSFPPLVRKTIKIGTTVIILIAFSLFMFRLDVSGWRGLTVASLVILASTSYTWCNSIPYPRTKKMPIPKEVEHQDLPPFLYIIFDEHMGIKWTPKNIPNAQKAKRDMLKFYEKFDFLLFPNAFSHYFGTDYSISNALNLSAEPTHVGLNINTKEKIPIRKLTRNKVFEILKSKGYRIRVYQSEYIDFCDPSDKGIEFCLEYGDNSIRDIQGTNIPTGDKALLIIGHWFSALGVYNKIIDPIRSLAFSTLDKEKLLHTPFFGSPYNRVGPLNVMPVLERIRSDLTRYPRNTAFFAHLLTPHYPYIYNDKGALITDPRKWLGLKEWYRDKYNPPLTDAYRSYYDQVLGLYNWLNIWFNDLREKGQLQDMVVIFHGDHGSRICEVKPYVKNISHQDWNRIVKDGFSTLFAIKDSRVPKGRNEMAKPIDILLKEFFFQPKKLTQSTPEGQFLLLIDGNSENLKKYNYDQW